MSKSPLHLVHDAGQSIWLDYIDRTILRNGELARRIRDDALTGMTSNPTIFEKALAEGQEEFSVTLGEKIWTQKPQKYHARSLGMLRAKYAAVADKAALDPVLEAAGCLAGLRA